MSGIPSWARVGAKVICIDDDEDACLPLVNATGLIWQSGLDGLTRGEIYTIRAAYMDEQFFVPVVRLVEIAREVMINDGGVERGFWLGRFKPLITIEDDISTHFAALLDVKQPSPVSA